MTRQRGQAATETMMVMMFLLLMIFGAVHLAMFATTKYMVNYASFTASRTVLVRGADSLRREARQAADAVLDGIRWWRDPARDRAQEITRRSLRGRDGVMVTYRVPFGLPIFQFVPPNGIAVRGFAPVVEQPPSVEKGDNAGR